MTTKPTAKTNRAQSAIAIGNSFTVSSLIPAMSAAVNADGVSGMGGKTIGFWGGIALLINNITGGSMVLFPQLYQQGGWLLVTIALLTIMVLSACCGMMFIESMALMKGNNRFQKRVEYTTVAEYYLPLRGYYVVQLFFQLCITCNNMSMIIQSVQVMDFTIVAIVGRSCALPQFVPEFGFGCPDPVIGDITPFGSTMYLIPLGWFVTAVIVFPLSMCNLDDNVKVQKGAFFSVILILLIWVGVFISRGLDTEYVPAVGGTLNNIMGTVIFNYALISSLPSWVNEKKKDVSIVWSLCIAMPMATLMFITLGFFGGMAFEPWTDSETILDKILSINLQITNITFYIFPVVVNLTSIPVFSIMQRYNLVEQKICSPFVANILAVVLPWVVVIPLYTGSGYQNLVNYAGIILNSAVNFIIPPIIYVIAIRRHEQEQTDIRKEVVTEMTTPKTVTEADAPAEPTLSHPLQPLMKDDAVASSSVQLHGSNEAAVVGSRTIALLPVVKGKRATMYYEAPPLSALTTTNTSPIIAVNSRALHFAVRGLSLTTATIRRVIGWSVPTTNSHSGWTKIILAFTVCILWLSLISYVVVWMSNVIAHSLGVHAVIMGFFVISVVVGAPVAAVRCKYALRGFSWAIDGSGDVILISLGFGIACLAYSAFVYPVSPVPIPIGEEMLIVLFTLFIMVSTMMICLMSLQWRINQLVLVAAAAAALVIILIELFILEYIPLLNVSSQLTIKDICSSDT